MTPARRYAVVLIVAALVVMFAGMWRLAGTSMPPLPTTTAGPGVSAPPRMERSTTTPTTGSDFSTPPRMGR